MGLDDGAMFDQHLGMASPSKPRLVRSANFLCLTWWTVNVIDRLAQLKYWPRSTEVRSQVYRYLFNPTASWNHTPHTTVGRKAVSEGYRDNDERELEKKAEGREDKWEWNTQARGRVYPTILRTSRAIDFEAAPLLYTKTISGMETCDVVCFSDTSSVHGIIHGGSNVWRHNFYAEWALVMQEVYRSMPPADDWPYGVPRLCQISEALVRSMVRRWRSSPLRIDSNCHFAVEDDVQFGATMRQSNVIRNLVSLLSNSPIISCLEVELYFTLTPGFETGLEALTGDAKLLKYTCKNGRRNSSKVTRWKNLSTT